MTQNSITEHQFAVIPGKPNGAATPLETATMGGSVFDPARWKTPPDARLDPTAKVKPNVTKIEVKKPPKDHFVHAHPAPEFNGVFPLYGDSEAKRYDPYLIAPELTLPPQAQVNVVSTRLAVAITDTGGVFLWYVIQTGSDWQESGDNCILAAMTRWVKVTSNSSGYDIAFPEVELPKPVFPDLAFGEYLARAFKGRYIASVDHDVIKRLAGAR
jgi:hypothetical protein